MPNIDQRKALLCYLRRFSFSTWGVDHKAPRLMDRRAVALILLTALPHAMAQVASPNHRLPDLTRYPSWVPLQVLDSVISSAVLSPAERFNIQRTIIGSNATDMKSLEIALRGERAKLGLPARPVGVGLPALTQLRIQAQRAAVELTPLPKTSLQTVAETALEASLALAIREDLDPATLSAWVKGAQDGSVLAAGAVAELKSVQNAPAILAAMKLQAAKRINDMGDASTVLNELLRERKILASNLVGDLPVHGIQAAAVLQQKLEQIAIAERDLHAKVSDLIHGPEGLVPMVTKLHTQIDAITKRQIISIDALSSAPTAKEVAQKIADVAEKVGEAKNAANLIKSLADGSASTTSVMAVLESNGVRIPKEVRDLKGVVDKIQTGEFNLKQQADALFAGRITSIRDIADVLPLKQLGLKDDAISGAKSAVNLFSNIATGNFLGALSAVPGLPSLGGSAAGNEEVLRALAAQDKKLDEIKLLQKETLKEVQAARKEIADLSAKVDEHHKLVMAMLDVIEREVLLTQALLAELLLKDVQTCRLFAPNLSSQPAGAPDVSSHRYTDRIWRNPPHTYTDIAIRFAAASQPDFQTCWTGIRTALNQDDSKTLLFWTNPSKTELDKYPQYAAARTFQTTFVSSHQKRASSLKDEVCSLASPAYSVEELSANLKRVPLTCAAVNLDAKDIISNEKFLNASAVNDVTEYLMGVLPVWMVADPQEGLNRLLPEDRVNNPATFTQEHHSRVCKVVLCDRWPSRALRYLNIAIAQQALLSGDRLLPAIAKGLSAKSEEDIALVQSNPLLRRNLLVYLLRSRLKLPMDFVKFQLAFSLQHENQMKEVLALPQYAAVTFNGSWTITLQGHPLPLPTPAEVRAGQLTWTAELQTLVDVRERLLDYITVSGITDENNRKMIAIGLLSH